MKPLQSGNNKYQIMAEINMIPFIDVALVLLIIFMVVTPFLVQSQIKVSLPKAVTAVSSREHPVEIFVTQDGTVYIKNRPVPIAWLEKELKRAIIEPAHQPVLIQADKNTAFERVVTVMDAVKKIGVAKLGVGVRQTLK